MRNGKRAVSAESMPSWFNVRGVIEFPRGFRRQGRGGLLACNPSMVSAAYFPATLITALLISQQHPLHRHAEVTLEPPLILQNYSYKTV